MSIFGSKKISLAILLLSVSGLSHAQSPVRLNDFVEIKAASGTLPAIVSQNVNVRAEPSAESSKLGLLNGGGSISAEFLLDSEWAKINYKDKDAYVHTSALIKQLYKADINHSTDDGVSSVFSMSGWHYPYLPGSYFINFQSNKYGHAGFGPLEGSGYDSIESKLYKLNYSKRDVYFTTTHKSGNRTYFSPYIAIPNETDLVIFQLPVISQGDENRIDLKGDTLYISGRAYDNCCSYEHYDIEINLKDFKSKGHNYYFDTEGEGVKKDQKPLILKAKKIKLMNNIKERT